MALCPYGGLFFMIFESIHIVTTMYYRSPLPVIDEEESVRMRSNSVSPVLSAPIVIPPILIPDSPTDKVRPCAPYAKPIIHTVVMEPAEVYVSPRIIQEEPPSRIPQCLCGYTKIVCGCVSCPIVCSLSCLAGTAYTLYNIIQCKSADYEGLKYRDTFCTHCGCGTAYISSYRLIESGLRDIRVQQDMFR